MRPWNTGALWALTLLALVVGLALIASTMGSAPASRRSMRLHPTPPPCECCRPVCGCGVCPCPARENAADPRSPQGRSCCSPD